MIYDNLIKENVAPKEASKIGIFKDDKLVGTIDLGGLKAEYGEKLYSFGLLSDLHLTSYDAGIPEVSYYYYLAKDLDDFQNALTFLSDKVDFYSACGDISWKGSEPELKLFKRTVDKYANGKPFYICYGNHELMCGDRGSSIACVSGYSYSTNVSKWCEYTKMSSPNTIIEKKHDKGTDYYIYLSMASSDFSKPYLNEDLDWLETQLKAHINERCFIFTHPFFPDAAGNYGDIYQYSISGDCLTRLTAMRDKYPNTIWFSGHSHWHWELQGTNFDYRFASKSKGRNFDANIWPVNGADRNSGWCIHVPSCGDPRNSNSTDAQYGDGNDMAYDMQGDDSQFAIVDVYEHYIDIKGISLEKGNLKYLPIAQYRVNTRIIVQPEPEPEPEPGPTQRMLYSFGLLSDVHMPWKDGIQNEAECYEDFSRALTYLNGKEAEMACICGDITTQGIKYDLNNYKFVIDEFHLNCKSDMPVYTCLGNHETWNVDWNNNHTAPDDRYHAPYRDAWKDYTGMGDDMVIPNGNTEVCPTCAANVCINKTHENITDHFIFLSVEKHEWVDGKCDNVYTKESIDWLSTILEKYKNDRCFIFMHFFFPDRAGNYGELYNNDLWLEGEDLIRLEALCDKYKRSIWFSGHSHCEWKLEGQVDTKGRPNNDANVWPIPQETRVGGYCVHVPSCGEPRGANEKGMYDIPKGSEFAYIMVYSDYIIMRCKTLKYNSSNEPVLSTWKEYTLKF